MTDKCYSLARTGWTTEMLVEKGTKVDVIKAIAKVSGEFDILTLDNNIVLTTPEGETFRDSQIEKWVSKNFNRREKAMYWLAKFL
jgi:hypothetical protein